MAGTWRAYRARESGSAIPLTSSSTGSGVPAARWSQMKLARHRPADIRGGSAASRAAKA